MQAAGGAYAVAAWPCRASHGESRSRARAPCSPATATRRCSRCGARRVASASLNLADLEPPPIDGDLRSLFDEAGAEWSEALGTATTFGDDEAALEALGEGVLVFDRTQASRVRVSGPDRLRFLHALCSAPVASLLPGSGTPSTLLTPTGRCVDAFTLLALDGSCLLLLSPGAGQAVAGVLEHHRFPADKVAVADISAQTAAFALVGARLGDVLGRMGAPADLGEQGVGTHVLVGFQGQPVVVAADCGLASRGVTLVADESIAGALWAALTGVCGALPAGTAVWERLRVAEGVPARGAEVTEDSNPLEAGLQHCVSTAKGCYLGQEVIARLTAREGPKQALWGLRLAPDTPCAPGDEIVDGSSGAALGKVTSACPEDGTALAFIKRAAAGSAASMDGAAVLVGPQRAPGVLQQTAYEQRHSE